MPLSSRLDRIHATVKNNRWLKYFTIFCRLSLSFGFIMAGYVKIIGERFTDLHNNQPMGHYLEALYHTGYYYTFIGILQILAAVMLLVPRTALLGALLYFPIILNICILSLAVRFEGSLLSSPLMVLANLYLLCWDYDRLKFILFPTSGTADVERPILSNKFPWKFFLGSFAGLVILLVILFNAFNIMPRNTMGDCMGQKAVKKNPKAAQNFCDCVHLSGKPLDQCLDAYQKQIEPNR